MSGIYDEAYYKSNNYVTYLQRKERYSKTATEILEFLNKIHLDQGPILDFGCAVGFLAEALIEAGLEVDPVDVSEWCIEEAAKKNLTIARTPDYDKEYGITFALDVLEHMPYFQITEFLNNLKTRLMVFRVPVCYGQDTDYYLEASRVDPTHVIRWNAQDWEGLLKHYGYQIITLNLSTIYCSKGVYCGIAIRGGIPKNEPYFPRQGSL